MSIMQLLANDNKIVVNRVLIREIGLYEAVIMGELCSEYVYWESIGKLTSEGMFYCTIETLEDATGLSEYKQRRCIRNLEEFGLIETELRGLPSMRYFKINEEQLLKILEVTSEEVSEMYHEKTNASRVSRVSRDSNIANKQSKLNSKLANKQSREANIDSREKEKDKKEKDSQSAQTKFESQAVVDSYHKICVSLPTIRSLSDKRKKALATMLKKYTLDDFNEAFTKAEQSDFLTGDNDRGWQANFDFFLREDKFLKILEGDYDNKKGRSAVKKLEKMSKRSERLTPEQKKNFKEAIASGKATRI